MAKGITRRQAQILEYIVECVREKRMPPTIAEIGSHFGIRSSNGVNDHLVSLEKKGYIRRSSKARDIQITDKGAFGLYAEEVGVLPLVGQIAAGQPILAQENVEGHVPVDGSLARREAFCLRVRGDSMIEDGILNGDIIIVDQQVNPSQGDIVVALMEDDATVKHYYRHGDMIELRPANASMQPMLIPARDVVIQGVVVALQRAIR